MARTLSIERLWIRQEDLKSDLLPILTGKLFHLTSLSAWIAIQISGAVTPNRNGEFKATSTQSHKSVGKHLDAVCLFDLRDKTTKQIAHGLSLYDFLSPWRDEPNYYLILNPSAYEAVVMIEGLLLSQADLLKFLNALRSHKDPFLYPLALSQFCLGLRIGEACGLSWESISLEEKWAKIQQVVIWDDRTWKPSLKPVPKNERVRFISMPDTLVGELTSLKKRLRNATGVIF